MKKLTLNQAWRLCLKQWKWIVKQIKAGDTHCVAILKRQWTTANGYDKDEIESECFFCEYCRFRNRGCGHCPGKLVNKRFNCANTTYEYDVKPLKFYAKLLELDKKRKAK